MTQSNRFEMFRRADGSNVACRISLVVCVGKGENGSVLHFGSGTQINVHESFEEVMAILTQEP